MPLAARSKHSEPWEDLMQSAPDEVSPRTPFPGRKWGRGGERSTGLRRATRLRRRWCGWPGVTRGSAGIHSHSIPPLHPCKHSLPRLRKRRLALREDGAGGGEFGRAEFREDFHGTAGMGQGLGGLALAHEGFGEVVATGGDQLPAA